MQPLDAFSAGSAGADHLERPDEVDAEDGLEVLGRQALEVGVRHELRGAGAVHQRVDAPPLVEHRFRHAAAVRVHRDVALKLGLAARHGRDLPATLSELADRGLAHAGRPAGDDGYFFHTVAIGVAGEPTAPGRRSGGAVKRKRLRLCARSQRASSLK